MRVRISIGAAILGLVGSALISTSASAETTLRALSAWPANLLQVKEKLYKFEERVTAASNGQIKFQNLGPETASANQQFEPLSNGIFDVNYTAAAYHQAQTGVAIALLLLGDMEKVRSSGMFDYINDYYKTKFGVEILALSRSPANQFVLREPLKNGRLDGRKIRSNPQYDAVIRYLGAVPVSMAPADAYAAMEKGTIDGVGWPAHSTAEWKLYEIGKYIATPGFGRAADLIIMNSAKLASLPADQQKIIREEALKIEQNVSFYESLAEEQQKAMTDKGVKITEFSAEDAVKINQVFGTGIVEVARKMLPKDVDAFVDMARSKAVFAY